MNKLSVCMIVKNGEKTIRKALDSVRPVAFETVVGVDSSSSDDTEKVVEKLTNQHFSFDWQDDFSVARNLTLDRATGSHILVLDADEWLTQQGQQAVNVLLTQAPDQFTAFLYKHFTTEGKEIGVSWGPIRVFPNRKDIRYHGRVHECVNLDKGMGVRMPIIAIEHTGYDPIGMQDKLNRNWKLLQLMLKEDPNDTEAQEYTQLQLEYERKNGMVHEEG